LNGAENHRQQQLQLEKAVSDALAMVEEKDRQLETYKANVSATENHNLH